LNDTLPAGAVKHVLFQGCEIQKALVKRHVNSRHRLREREMPRQVEGRADRGRDWCPVPFTGVGVVELSVPDMQPGSGPCGPSIRRRNFDQGELT